MIFLLSCLSSEPNWSWEIPEHFPLPRVPENNLMTEKKFQLGRLLFYDKRLSVNNSSSCATCHKQELSFTDGLAQSVGATGERHPRSSMSLANIAYSSSLTWSNPMLTLLEHQMLVPMFGEDPVELGLSGQVEQIENIYTQDVLMSKAFKEAFPNASKSVTIDHITQSIAVFLRGLISKDAPYDRYLNGEKDALNPQQKKGMELFFSERLECFHCHAGFNFSDSVDDDGNSFTGLTFHNTGLYSLDEEGSYPPDNQGLYAFTKKDSDRGKFKAPSLRNIEVTAPYMHDGSIDNLEDVLEHYAHGGRYITEGPNKGDGTQNPNKSEFVAGFILMNDEKEAVVAFLEGLTDDAFLNSSRYSDPWN